MHFALLLVHDEPEPQVLNLTEALPDMLKSIVKTPSLTVCSCKLCSDQ